MGVDLRELTVDAFEQHRDSTFTLAGAHGPIPMVLAQVRRGPAPAGFRPSFSLTFHLARGTPQQQGLHPLTHPTLGTLELFLVPLQATPTHARYEAVFG